MGYKEVVGGLPKVVAVQHREEMTARAKADRLRRWKCRPAPLRDPKPKERHRRYSLGKCGKA